MLPEGSKLFWTHERIEEFIARTASESAQRPLGRPGEATDLSAFLLTRQSRNQKGLQPHHERSEIRSY